MNQRLQKQIAAMKLVEQLSTQVETTSWLWGGFVADIYSGHQLRDHHDLDYLTHNLFSLLPMLQALLVEAGWETQVVVNGDLTAQRDEVRLHFGHVQDEIADDSLSCWIHNGDRGQLRFSRRWLPSDTVSFYAVALHVVAPALQYTLLQNPEQLNPAWRPRPQDQMARVVLESFISAS